MVSRVPKRAEAKLHRSPDGQLRGCATEILGCLTRRRSFCQQTKLFESRLKLVQFPEREHLDGWLEFRESPVSLESVEPR